MEKPEREKQGPFCSLRSLLPGVSKTDNAAAVLSHAVTYINDLRTKIENLESQLPNDQEVTSREVEAGVEVEVKITGADEAVRVHPLPNDQEVTSREVEVAVEIIGADEAVVRVKTKNMRYAEARVMEALRDLDLKLHHATISNLNNITSQLLVVGLPSPLQTTQQGIQASLLKILHHDDYSH